MRWSEMKYYFATLLLSVLAAPCYSQTVETESNLPGPKRTNTTEYQLQHAQSFGPGVLELDTECYSLPKPEHQPGVNCVPDY
ncbi:hypothetical protein [Buttiauxella sp.]|uniref:hypothetical protein n=1 Tax=Buttiauxella sp. TaxID=1972222 RepID=UPI003C74B9A3